MKIIFLDVDGVMNNAHFHSQNEFDGYNLACLRYIVEQTGANIVLSSHWRIGETLESAKRKYFKQYHLEDRLIGLTPFGGYSASRGSEIQYFLDNFKEDVESFVIIDDDNDMLHLTSNLVQTKAFRGLIKKEADKAIKILNGEVI